MYRRDQDIHFEKQISINDLRIGNHKIYEMLFTQESIPLCDYAYGMIYNINEAEDIAQKMFCKLWNQRDRIDILLVRYFSGVATTAELKQLNV